MRRENHPIKDVIVAGMEGKRPRGRPRIRWLDSISEDGREAGVDTQAYGDRGRWRRLVGVAIMDCLWFVGPPQ